MLSYVESTISVFVRKSSGCESMEKREAISAIENEDQMDMLTTLIDGRRLRDISDLPFDLAT